MNGAIKYKAYAVSKNKSQKSTKTNIKSKKQSAAAIQNYFDNSKVNNSITYAVKNSNKKPKKRSVAASKTSKHNFTDSKNKGVTDEMLSELGDKQNVCLVNIKQPFNMYNTTHNFMTKSNNHSFNLSYNLGATGGQEKKPKKYSTSSNKHQKNGVYSSYSNNGSKKKQTRASSNTEASHMHITKQEDYMSRSSKKKKNILFKLASELSQSPDRVKIKKSYGRDSKNRSKDPNIHNLYKAFTGFEGDCSGNRMNTEATDDASLNSGRNKAKNRPVVIYNDINDVPIITLDDSNIPNSKGARTISNEFDYYNKSRNEDAITCKRD